MKAFVLSIFDGECTAILAVVLASSREEAMKAIGSEEDGQDGFESDITSPTKGVDEEVRQRCQNATFDSISLDEMPLVTA